MEYLKDEKGEKKNNTVLKGLILDTNNQAMLRERIQFLKEHLEVTPTIKWVQRI